MKLPIVGDTVASKYRLERVVGRGGFATVYEALDVDLERRVAVKVLTPGEHGYPATTATRFEREARALAALTDPHTIRMFDYGRTPDGVLYMVFELLPGADLSDHLREVGPMSEADTIHVIRQLLRSLREAHAARILHRDIKPANVRIYEYGGDPLRVKLMDFGIARLMGADAQSITATGKVVGTVRYMSPEQVMGGELTAASDIFTLGALAHEMLTGDNRPALQKVSDETLEIPTSRGFALVLERMLTRDPAERFGSAQAALDALESIELAVTKPILAPPKAQSVAAVPRPPEPRQPAAVELPPKPRPGAPRIVLGVVAVSLMFAVLAVVLTSREQEEAAAEPARRSNVNALIHQAPSAPAIVASTQVADLPPSATGCGAPVSQRGQNARSSLISGLNRESWLTYVPKSYDPTRAHPLLLVFHPDGSTPTEVMRVARLTEFADEHGFLILAPDRRQIVVAFRDGVSPNLIHKMYEETRATYCVDETRVFAFGSGGGGGGVESLTCSSFVKAFATTSYRFNTPEFLCEPAEPRPNLYFAPLLSKHLPLEGGVTCANYETIVSLEAHDQMWAERNRCVGDRREYFRDGKSVCYTWDCEEPYVTCHINGGHAWKGHRRPIDVLNCDGPPADFPHLETMWQFFEEAVKPTPETEPTSAP